MSQVLGMDVEGVKQLSAQLHQSAAEIRHLVSTLSARVHSVTWTGPDHDRFVNDWQSQHLVHLNTVADALDAASQRANQNAVEQEHASQNG